MKIRDLLEKFNALPEHMKDVPLVIGKADRTGRVNYVDVADVRIGEAGYRGRVGIIEGA